MGSSSRLSLGLTWTLISSQYLADDSTWEQVWHIIQDLRFYCMHSLSIAFGVIANEDFGMNYANDMFTLAFSSFRTPQLPYPLPPRPYSLSIENVPSDYMSTSLDFSELLQNIRRLELRTITLQNSTFHPNRKKPYRETMSFYARLPRLWIMPASQTLTVLHLSADAPWGWYPKIDLRGIHFPHLKDLMLSRFTFSHDWQMDWLLNHSRSLKRLSLTKCAILDHATSTRQHFDSEGYPLRRETGREGPQVMGSYQYQKRWSDYFESFASFLPSLQSFSLLASGLAARDTYHQDVLDDKIVRASRAHDRYLKYTSVRYTPLFNRWGGYSNFGSGQMKQDEEDPRALRELLAVIRWRNRTVTQTPS